MRRVIDLILLIAVAALMYAYRDRVEAMLRHLLYAPCAKPIEYSIGTFDARFGVSKQYFLDALKSAEAIWEKPTGKDLFKYADDGYLKVNMVFDYREQTTNKLAGIDATLKSDQATYDAYKAQYDGLKQTYASLKAEYDSRVASFNQRNANYAGQVSYWNKKGETSRETYDSIEAERKALQAEAASLQSLQAELNGTVNEINALATKLNGLAATLNLNVGTYNGINATRGDEFEQGLYESDGVHEKIDIFEFSDHEKLVRLLAHELGHALGLDHISDPNGIMYELNQGSGLTATKADLAAINTLCGVR